MPRPTQPPRRPRSDGAASAAARPYRVPWPTSGEEYGRTSTTLPSSSDAWRLRRVPDGVTLSAQRRLAARSAARECLHQLLCGAAPVEQVADVSPGTAKRLQGGHALQGVASGQV